MRRIGLCFSILGGGICLFVQPLQSQEFSPSSKAIAACESFGIQRFQARKDPPPFSLKNLDGKQVSLSEYKGKPLLLFFWASWCLACKEDIVLLEKFFERARGEIEFLTIVIDGEKEKRVKGIVKDQKITLPVLLDQKEKIARTYGVRMVPTAFLINRENVMEGMVVGQRDWCAPEALSAIKELLDFR